MIASAARPPSHPNRWPAGKTMQVFIIVIALSLCAIQFTACSRLTARLHATGQTPPTRRRCKLKRIGNGDVLRSKLICEERHGREQRRKN
jgi:hypothetical protein